MYIVFDEGERFAMSLVEKLTEQADGNPGKFMQSRSGYVWTRDDGSQGGASPFLFINYYKTKDGETKLIWTDGGWLSELYSDVTL